MSPCSSRTVSAPFVDLGVGCVGGQIRAWLLRAPIAERVRPALALADAAVRGRGLAVPVPRGPRSAYLSPCRSRLQPRLAPRASAKATCLTICPAHTFTFDSGVMDRTNVMQRVQRLLEQGDEMVNKYKADQQLIDEDISIQRVEADIKRRLHRREKDGHISFQRDEFDKALDTKHSELAKTVQTGVIALLNTVLNDQRDTNAMMKKRDRALSDETLCQAREEYNAAIKIERKICDSAIEKVRDQLVAMENERGKMKTLIQSLMKQEDVRANVEAEDMIHIPRRLMSRIIDCEPRPSVVMHFKLHGVQEIYPDLQKYYDSREELAEIGITDPEQVSFWFLSQHLSMYYGYEGDAKLYYRSPAPGSEALVEIEGPEDVVKMVDAHAEARTRLCHMYIVNGTGFFDKDGFPKTDDDHHPYQNDWEYSAEDEDEPYDVTSPVMKKQRADE